MSHASDAKTLPITVIIPTRNEAANLGACLRSLKGFAQVVVVDSQSTDDTVAVAHAAGAEVHQFHYSGGWPKKRQWALENLEIRSPWTLLLDADERMTAALGIVDRGRQGLAAKYRDKLQERIAELLGPKGAALDAGRLEQEVALFADKADIEEEIIRLRAHLSRLNDILSDESDEGKGRALEFLNQEILREVNTIGSKSRDLDIITQVLELKNLAESMKEQTANIE